MVLENIAVLEFGGTVNGPNVENEWKNTAQLSDHQKCWTLNSVYLFDKQFQIVFINLKVL